jgi:hypothetical protein
MEDEIFWRESHTFDSQKAEENRNKFLSKKLTTDQKMELYNCSVGGNINSLKTLIETKDYPLMEECSANGYFWTVLHYAAHYGFDTIIIFILEYYQNHSDKKTILNLQSNLGMSPLFICINSSASVEKKMKIIELFAQYDAIDFSICNKENEDIYDICKKFGLVNHLMSCLKED